MPRRRKAAVGISPQKIRAAFQSFKHFQQLAERCNSTDCMRLAALVGASLSPDSPFCVYMRTALDLTSTGQVQVLQPPRVSHSVEEHPAASAILAALLPQLGQGGQQAAVSSSAAAGRVVASSSIAAGGGAVASSAAPQVPIQHASPPGLHDEIALFDTPPRAANQLQVGSSSAGSGIDSGSGSGSGLPQALAVTSSPASSSPESVAAGPVRVPHCMKCSRPVETEECAPLQCEHLACASCVSRVVQDAVAKHSTQDMQCLVPGCGSRWLPQHVTPCLAPSVLEAYEQCMIQEALGGGAADSQGGGELFVTCPNTQCGRQMLMEQQSLSSARTAANSAKMAGVRDANGTPVSFDALLHKELHRLRCGGCAQNFCTKCNTMPYHLGRTCEQHVAFQSAVKCRFCGEALSAGAGAGDVCEGEECQTRSQAACTHTLACGHVCGGVAKEKVHLPCLKAQCLDALKAGTLQREPRPRAPRKPRAGAAATKAAAAQLKLVQLYDVPVPTSNEDDYCTICYVEGLSAAPSVQLLCGHVLHWQCVKRKIEGSWSGARITFGFLNCPQCQQLMQHPLLDSLPAYQTAMKLKANLEENALKRLKFENLEKAPEIIKPGAQFHLNPLGYAMHRFAYYPCFKCKQPYFGGMRACGAPAAVGADGSFDPKELVCGSCRPPATGVNACSKHGKDFVQRKCRFCCSPAVWFCWGSTSFCEPCHSKHNRTGLAGKPQSFFKQCAGPATCPLRMRHPPNGGKEEFSMGCGICGAEGGVAAGGAF